jgi:hypothetical protein
MTLSWRPHPRLDAVPLEMAHLPDIDWSRLRSLTPGEII